MFPSIGKIAPVPLTRSIARNPEYEEIDFSKYGTESPDSSLPFVYGTVYYRRNFDWDGESSCSLEVGVPEWHASSTDAMPISSGALTGFEFSIDRDMLKVGRNELVLPAICATTAWLHQSAGSGRSGGISGSVVTHGYRTSRIVDARVELYGLPRGDLLVEVAGAGWREWELIDPCAARSLAGRCDLAPRRELLCVFTRRLEAVVGF